MSDSRRRWGELGAAPRVAALLDRREVLVRAAPANSSARKIYRQTERLSGDDVRATRTPAGTGEWEAHTEELRPRCRRHTAGRSEGAHLLGVDGGHRLVVLTCRHGRRAPDGVRCHEPVQPGRGRGAGEGPSLGQCSRRRLLNARSAGTLGRWRHVGDRDVLTFRSRRRDGATAPPDRTQHQVEITPDDRDRVPVHDDSPRARANRSAWSRSATAAAR